MEEFISKLDSERFGFKIARAGVFREPVENALLKLRKLGVKMVIGRVKSGDIEKINDLENNGFRVMDTQLTYRRDTKDFVPEDAAAAEGVLLREFSAGDTGRIASIAEKAFENYGHYSADSRLDRNKCREIYRDWAQRSCLDKKAADIIFVAEVKGVVAGFATYRIHQDKTLKYVSCGLGAVSPEFRGRKIYPAIVNHAMAWGKGAGMEWEEYSCIACNFPANRAYINAGFKPVDSFLTLHCWLD
jgi:GNAT superfamily N-acetyltransferase